MVSMPQKKIDLTKVPLAFAEGGVLKKAAQWNQKNILAGGTVITPEVIDEYEDVALYIPTSLRIEKSIDYMRELVEGNIRNYKNRQQTGRMQDLSQTYAPGEVVFKQGDAAAMDCYFIVEGSFDVVINDKNVGLFSHRFS